MFNFITYIYLYLYMYIYIYLYMYCIYTYTYIVYTYTYIWSRVLRGFLPSMHAVLGCKALGSMQVETTPTTLPPSLHLGSMQVKTKPSTLTLSLHLIWTRKINNPTIHWNKFKTTFPHILMNLNALKTTNIIWINHGTLLLFVTVL